jgi:hypothetical protein
MPSPCDEELQPAVAGLLVEKRLKAGSRLSWAFVRVLLTY